MSGPVTAIVVGGSAGVGRAVVTQLIAAGHVVGVIARGQDRLDTMAADLGDAVRCASADAGDASALDRAVTGLVPDPAALRVWVNAAMATSFSLFGDMEVDEFDRILRTTFLGQVNGTRIALRLMARGNIVNVGSGLAYRPVPGQSAYCAAKHAINGFTGAVRSEILRDKRPVALSLVQLPAINTPQFTWARNRFARMPQPAPPIFAPEVAARAVMRAIDRDSREIFVGGAVLKLVFGDMILPGYIDRKLAREGIEMQQSDRPDPGGRPDNLMAPVAHAATAGGAFGDRARDSGLIVDADLARRVMIGGALALAFVAGLLLG